MPQSTPESQQLYTLLAISSAGGQAKVAKALEISRQAVFGWAQRGKVPADKVMILCHMVAHRVTPEQLRPDVFGQTASQAR
jgi:DNA-binding transcriptional regulator YdaS (Cro superfamily)